MSQIESDRTAVATPQGADFSGAQLPPALDIKNVGIIFNPISGQGKSRQLAEGVADMLSHNYISCQLIQSSRPGDYDPTALKAQFQAMDVVMVAGGDGTIMGLLPYLAESGKPVYMIPSGNESLFSRAFGMKRDREAVLAALRQGHVEQHSFGMANGAAFFTMATVGIDSVIVSEISAGRKGPIGHIGYVWPTLKQLLCYSPPAISLKVDGAEVFSNEPGYLIVANTSKYALDLNLVPEADSTGQQLCARFFPKGDVIRLMTIAAGRLCGFDYALEGSILFRGTSFEIAGKEGFPAQADGEAVGALPLKIQRSDKRISVITGVGRR